MWRKILFGVLIIVVPISAQADGVITDIDVKDFSVVKKGMPGFRLELMVDGLSSGEPTCISFVTDPNSVAQRRAVSSKVSRSIDSMSCTWALPKQISELIEPCTITSFNLFGGKAESVGAWTDSKDGRRKISIAAAPTKSSASYVFYCRLLNPSG